MNYIASYIGCVMKVAVNGYYAGKAWLCMCVGVEPPLVTCDGILRFISLEG